FGAINNTLGDKPIHLTVSPQKDQFSKATHLRLRTTSNDGILPDVIYLRRKLLATLVVAQSMILFPLDGVLAAVKPLPVPDYLTHRFVTHERQNRVQMVR